MTSDGRCWKCIAAGRPSEQCRWPSIAKHKRRAVSPECLTQAEIDAAKRASAENP